ncbi:MAG TPA: P27 family phage terminase small subunit [Steroidobacter sp.]|uniref:P27 family phage terminase small subunit n=1 Tax=Steroidobacter sp. TaxID=1978227 RepID=UPI002ED9A020
MTKATKKPPKSGNELRRRVLDEHAIDSTAALALLDVAAQALDQALAAEAVLTKEGLVVPGSRGPRPHPAAAIARDARMRLLAAMKSLHLEL